MSKFKVTVSFEVKRISEYYGEKSMTKDVLKRWIIEEMEDLEQLISTITENEFTYQVKVKEL